MHLFLLMFLFTPIVVETAVPGCHGDEDKDNRPRQNCTGARHTQLPTGFEPSTKVLLFPRNRFSDLTWSNFSIFTEIHEIDLSYNQIPLLTPSGAPVLPSLSVLRLGYNQLRSVPDHCFSGSPALTELYLHNNVINSLKDNSFSGLSKLEILDLSDNHIQTLPAMMMHPLKAIETLYLESNKIKVLPDEWFGQKEEVNYLYLSANPWACSCAAGYLRRYLEEYEYNVYVRDGPVITVDVDSVICDTPPSLHGQSVIRLEESDFCQDQPSPTYAATQPATTNPTTTPLAATLSALEQEFETKNYYRVVTWYETFTRHTEWSENWESALRGDGRIVKKTTAFPTIFPTTTFTTEATTKIQKSTKWPTTLQTSTPKWPTMLQTSPPKWPTMLQTSTPKWPTFPTTTEDQEATIAILEMAETTPTELTLNIQTISNVSHTSEISTLAARNVFCFWLFVSCVLLCVASGICTLLTTLRMYFWYNGVYKSLKCVIAGKEQVQMVAYFKKVEESGINARYRSVLFVSKDEKNENVEELDLGENSKNEDVKMVEKVIYRKTLYRVISKEEEIELHKDVIAECMASGGKVEIQKSVGSKKHYSVILREMNEKHGGETESCDWVVGGWEVEKGEELRSSWVEWLGQFLPSMPWGVTAPPKVDAELEE